ncbi:partial Sporulation kinase E, partial [Anaerolineae bacterium]
MPRKSTSKTKTQLIVEFDELQVRLDEAQEILRAIRNGEVDALIVSGVDGEQVFALKQVEEALRLSEEKYRTLVDEVNDGFYVTDSAGIFTFANPALARMYGVESTKALVGQKFSDFLAPEMPAVLDEAYGSAMQTGNAPEIIKSQIMRLDGTRAFIEVKPTMIVKGGQIVGTRGVVRDVTERKRAEKSLSESEERFRSLYENVPTGIYRTSADGRILLANPALVRMLGYETFEDLARRNLEEEDYEPKYPRSEFHQRMKSEGEVKGLESDWKRKDGTVIYVRESAKVITDGDGNKLYYEGTVEDITDSKRAEEALRASEERFRALIENSADVIALFTGEGIILYESPSVRRILGYSSVEMVGHNGFEFIHPDDYAACQELFGKLIQLPQTTVTFEFRHKRKDDTWAWVQATGTNLLAEPSVKALVVNYHDITERKRADEKIRRQLEHLTALSAIDQVIASNFDLEFCLSEILIHVTIELGVDAADILILNPNSQMLEYGAARGSRTKALRKTQVRLGESYAGRAILERQLVQIPNLREEPDNLFLTPLLSDDDFVRYYGVPLIIKGEVKGVLEVFHRAALEPDAEWLDFLNALAGQAALAIENSTLFERLQHSNLELVMAYDATIEGWSRALDLRDKETEGHTQRVTEITVRLAKALGIG